jgi:hypothetical protein
MLAQMGTVARSCSAAISLILSLLSAPTLNAANFLLEFVQADKETIERNAPKLPDQYQDARFFVTGFDDPSGVWRSFGSRVRMHVNRGTARR